VPNFCVNVVLQGSKPGFVTFVHIHLYPPLLGSIDRGFGQGLKIVYCRLEGFRSVVGDVQKSGAQNKKGQHPTSGHEDVGGAGGFQPSKSSLCLKKAKGSVRLGVGKERLGRNGTRGRAKHQPPIELSYCLDPQGGYNREKRNTRELEEGGV